MTPETASAYEIGLDFVPLSDLEWKGDPNADGFAVYSNCSEEAPRFERFFVHRLSATRHAERGNRYGGRMLSDPGVFEACLVPEGVVVANDCDVDTHQELRDRIARWRELGGLEVATGGKNG